MKKILFVILGFIAIGTVFAIKANAQEPATSDLYCEEAPPGTPVCNVPETNWANRRKQLGVDEVCCVYKESGRGNRGGQKGVSPKSTTTAPVTKGSKASAPKAAAPKPAPAKVEKPAPKVEKPKTESPKNKKPVAAKANVK